MNTDQTAQILAHRWEMLAQFRYFLKINDGAILLIFQFFFSIKMPKIKHFKILGGGAKSLGGTCCCV